VIVGAGPAGASLAHYLSKYGIEAKVYEALSSPGRRPCAWGVPRQIEKFLPLRKEHVLNIIDSIDLYLDYRLLYTADFKGGWGYIIDKPNWLKGLLESSNAKVRYKRRVNLNDVSRLASDGAVVAIAVGRHASNAKDLKLNVVEYLMETSSWPSNKIEFWFDSAFVGYTWVFPRGEREVSVGVGGFQDFSTLKRHLDAFVSKHPKLQSAKKRRVLGDVIVVSGLARGKLSPWKNAYAIGEAAGAVFPITGEGIRPSVITSFALAEAIHRGTSYAEELEKTGLPFAMSVQKLILALAMQSTPEERRHLLASLPLEKSVVLATGEFTKADLLNQFPEIEDVIDELEKSELSFEDLINQGKEPGEK